MVKIIYLLTSKKFATTTCLHADDNHDAGPIGLLAASKRFWGGSLEHLSSISMVPGGKAGGMGTQADV